MTGSEAPFARIGIIGTGLIGGSIALAAKQTWPSVQVIGTPSRSAALPAGMLDRTESDVASLARDSDLVVLCVPVSVMPDTMATLARSGSTAVVTDVGSTKRTVMATARAAGLEAFVGGHPMAGAERPGASEARADLFVGRPWLLVEGTASPDDSVRVETFARALGAFVQWMPADLHDRTVAYVSHLPQIVAAALMNAAETAVPTTGPHVAGNAFGEMTRLASSPAPMWQGICADNADFVAEALRAFLAQLPGAGTLADGNWMPEALGKSGTARDRWRAVRQETTTAGGTGPARTTPGPSWGRRMRRPYTFDARAPVVLPPEVRRAMIEHARRDHPLECCGLLVGRGDVIVEAVPMRNVEASTTRFRIDDREHIALRRELRQRSPSLDVVGVYHSHPDGPSRPSPSDVAEAYYPDWVYVVIGGSVDRPRVRGFAIDHGRAWPLRLCTRHR